MLNVVSSPRSDDSASIAVADAFLERLRQRVPDLEVDTLEVWAEHLPELDGVAAAAKRKAVRGHDLTEEEAARWSAITGLAARFAAADRLVTGVPMWNWAYPYELKQLIDLITHRGLMHTVEGDGIGPGIDVPLGLALLVRGQASPEWGGRPPERFDHQSSYIEFWLRLVGVREVRTLVVEHTWDDLAGPALEWGRAQARAMADAF